MSLDFLYSPDVLLFLSACLAMLVFILFSILMSHDLTRPVVIVLGLSFVAVGVLGHVLFFDMLDNGRELASAGVLSEDVLKRFERYHSVFAYLFPFVSAAIGSNVVSDALLKHHEYKRSFSVREFLRDLVQVALFPVGLGVGAIVGVLLLICAPIAPARRRLATMLPGIRRWTQLKALKISIIARHKVRTKGPGNVL